ncbi:helix-turn-helix transcriptional regulator [Methylopila musalis]|uniref:Helix-turn-helix transcriptional regulator n=1 Tax=Methylopila musalis TaxID=1134781 RepID=A0ABW3Z347_9HYPH
MIAETLSQNLVTYDAGVDRVENSVARGLMLAKQVQPGLFASGYDLKYLVDVRLEVEETPSIFCGVLISGDDGELDISGYGSLTLPRSCPIVMGFGGGARCIGNCRAGTHCAGAGFRLYPSFFESIRDEEEGVQLEPLRAMLTDAFMLRWLPPSARLIELARLSLGNPYVGALSRLFLQGCALAFIAETARLLAEHDSDDDAPSHGLSEVEYERVMALTKIIDDSIVDPPSLAQMGRSAGINTTTLTRQFRQVHGVTIFEYIRNRRLELARDLLRSRPMQVSQVGYLVGFGNPAAFATAYRRRYGFPPSCEKVAAGRI